jgi:hypothetical protein
MTAHMSLYDPTVLVSLVFPTNPPVHHRLLNTLERPTSRGPVSVALHCEKRPHSALDNNCRAVQQPLVRFVSFVHLPINKSCLVAAEDTLDVGGSQAFFLFPCKTQRNHYRNPGQALLSYVDKHMHRAVQS